MIKKIAIFEHFSIFFPLIFHCKNLISLEIVPIKHLNIKIIHHVYFQISSPNSIRLMVILEHILLMHPFRFHMF